MQANGRAVTVPRGLQEANQSPVFTSRALSVPPKGCVCCAGRGKPWNALKSQSQLGMPCTVNHKMPCPAL